MAVRNANAVVNVLNVVTALVSNGFIQECAEKGATCIDVERISSLRKQYANEGEFRNDMSLALNALNRLFFDESPYRLTIQNKGRGRSGGWWVVAFHQGATSKVTDTDYDDDQEQEQEHQERKRQRKQERQEQEQVTQEQEQGAGNAVSIIKRPDKDRSALVFIDKEKRQLLKDYAREHGMWLMWNRRYSAWNIQRKGLSDLVDYFKQEHNMTVRVDEHVRSWIEQERQERQKKGGGKQEQTLTIRLVTI